MPVPIPAEGSAAARTPVGQALIALHRLRTDLPQGQVSEQESLRAAERLLDAVAVPYAAYLARRRINPAQIAYLRNTNLNASADEITQILSRANRSNTPEIVAVDELPQGESQNSMIGRMPRGSRVRVNTATGVPSENPEHPIAGLYIRRSEIAPIEPMVAPMGLAYRIGIHPYNLIRNEPRMRQLYRLLTNPDNGSVPEMDPITRIANERIPANNGNALTGEQMREMIDFVGWTAVVSEIGSRYVIRQEEGRCCDREQAIRRVRDVLFVNDNGKYSLRSVAENAEATTMVDMTERLDFRRANPAAQQEQSALPLSGDATALLTPPQTPALPPSFRQPPMLG